MLKLKTQHNTQKKTCINKIIQTYMGLHCKFKIQDEIIQLKTFFDLT